MSRTAPSYVSLQGEPEGILTFSEPSATALATIREALVGLKVVPFSAESDGLDAWNEVVVVGTVDDVMGKLTRALVRDHSEVRATLSDICESSILVCFSNFHPDALHVVTKLTDRSGNRGSVSYGARIQRVAAGTFALWSDY